MTRDAVIAANRFGLGARASELKDVGGDARDWLRVQVDGTRDVPAEIRSLPNSAAAFEQYQRGRQERREARDDAAKKTGQDDEEKKQMNTLRQKTLPLYQDQVAARYRVATRSSESFRERLVHFWTNHFAVSADKPQVLALAGTLENEAIRPNLSKSFVDMLLAVESHPAMILYLDNQASMGPDSMAAQRDAKRKRPAGRNRGINENLAREILELHTLGVNSGYTQADVTAFARALTGWSVGSGSATDATPDSDTGHFVFRVGTHEPGAQIILGKRYAEDGLDQARAVLRDLARHAATATHIATKLVRHFIADTPPATAVERIAKVFRDTNGNLPQVHAALIDLPDAWQETPQKFKTPHEFVVATFRLFDFVPQQPQQILAPFQLLGQRPYTPGSPAGWPDVASQWDGPDALLNRIEWSTQLGTRVGKRFAPLDIAAAGLGESLTARTRQAISRAESAAQGVTLLLASPDFQRR